MTDASNITPHPRAVARKPTEPGAEALAVQAELEVIARAIARIEGDAAELDTTPIEVVSADELVEAEEEACA